jgi:hypothetical protein
MESEVFMEVEIKAVFFGVMTVYNFIGCYQCFD